MISVLNCMHAHLDLMYTFSFILFIFEIASYSHFLFLATVVVYKNSNELLW